MYGCPSDKKGAKDKILNSGAVIGPTVIGPTVMTDGVTVKRVKRSKSVSDFSVSEIRMIGWAPATILKISNHLTI
jgi:hypothetical protein